MNLRYENIEPTTYMCRVAKSLRFLTFIKIFTCFQVSKVNYFKLNDFIGFQEFWSFLCAAHEKNIVTVLNQDFFKYFFGKNRIKLSVNILGFNASECANEKYIYILHAHSTLIVQEKKKKERKQKYIYTLV